MQPCQLALRVAPSFGVMCGTLAWRWAGHGHVKWQYVVSFNAAISACEAVAARGSSIRCDARQSCMDMGRTWTCEV
eukprot:24609-Karenia_brevis.AAC.1